jgi:hypothetical protein
LHLAIALSHAKIGHDGDAWRHWDHADRAASELGDQYAHPWLIFGRGIVDGYAIDILNDLMKPGEAVKRADQFNLSSIPSATRRSRHTIQVARAFHLNREPVATVHLLRKAEQEAPDTIQFDPFTRAVLVDLAENGGATVRDDARDLSRSLGLLPNA